jgi:hypothetical protein
MNKCKTYKPALVKATKTHEWMEVEFHSFLTLVLGGVGQLHLPAALPSEKEPHHPRKVGLMGHRNGQDTFCRSEKYRALVGNQTAISWLVLAVT